MKKNLSRDPVKFQHEEVYEEYVLPINEEAAPFPENETLEDHDML